MANQEAGRRLYVGNIQYEVTERELRDIFAAHAAVESIELLVNKSTGLPRGFGFVTLVSAGDAEAAIESLSGMNLRGRSLRVSLAKARPGAAYPTSRSAHTEND